MADTHNHSYSSVESINALAAQFRRAEAAGRDLTTVFRNKYGKFIAAVARGQFLPELFAGANGNDKLLERLAGLHPSEQQRLVAQGCVIGVLRRQPDGAMLLQDVPLCQLEDSELPQVFARKTAPRRKQPRPVDALATVALSVRNRPYNVPVVETFDPNAPDVAARDRTITVAARMCNHEAAFAMAHFVAQIYATNADLRTPAVHAMITDGSLKDLEVKGRRWRFRIRRGEKRRGDIDVDTREVWIREGNRRVMVEAAAAAVRTLCECS
jgi:hypothetical protein